MSRYRMSGQTADVAARAVVGKEGQYTVSIDGRQVVVDAERTPDGGWRIQMDGGPAQVVVVTRDGQRRWVEAAGSTFVAEEASDTADGAADDGGLEAPMPGKVLEVLVAVGDAVTEGQVLLIMEAMKMEHAIKAPHDGVVTEISAAVDQMVEPGKPLVAVEADDVPESSGGE